MKILLLLFSLALTLTSTAQRDPGTGSNPTVGPGPATPDAGSSDTSIMGYGTPGNQGMDTYDVKDPDQEDLDRIQKEEEIREKKSLKLRDEIKKK